MKETTNPYVATQESHDDPSRSVHEIDYGVAMLRFVMIPYGALGFGLPLLLAYTTDRAYIDLVALYLFSVGLRSTRKSFTSTFRVVITCVLLCSHPWHLILDSVVRSHEFLQLDYWFSINRARVGNPLPMAFLAAQAIAALVIIFLTVRLHLMQRLLKNPSITGTL